MKNELTVITLTDIYNNKLTVMTVKDSYDKRIDSFNFRRQLLLTNRQL